jgi:hypothetical protein
MPRTGGGWRLGGTVRTLFQTSVKKQKKSFGGFLRVCVTLEEDKRKKENERDRERKRELIYCNSYTRGGGLSDVAK